MMPNEISSNDADGTISSPGGRSLGQAQVDETLAAEMHVDALLVSILDDYLAGLKAGAAPSREQLLAQYPQFSEPLKACLAGLEFIYHADTEDPGSRQQLGDFRLLREIGRGGMGVVYEAEQASLHRRVAVKVLRFASVSDVEAIDRFRREAETVAHLHHTNIVPIFFVGNEKGVNFYAMEFIQGRSLADVLAEQEGPIDPMTVIGWGVQVAEALAHAHQRGVIHRDIKPSNLLLDDEGRIWLTDFGLAIRIDNVTLSMTGAIIGTPRYMSPEQASAARHRLDHRTDIYSLGATLYELMTARPVYNAETPHQVIDQILNQDPIPPRSVTPAVSRDVETILLKCLAKQPEQRYASAQVLADDFRAVLDHRPIKTRRASLLERSTQWARKHRVALTWTARSVLATAALLMLILLGVRTFRQRQLVDVSFATDQAPLAAEIRDTQGELVALQTVPTQQAVVIPAGNYQIQVSGDSRLSETYQVNLKRGDAPKFDVNLDESLLMPPLEVDGTYQIVSADGHALVVMIDDTGLSCWDPQQNQLRWTTPLANGTQPLLEKSVGWVWPWKRLMTSSPYTGWGSFDLKPFIVTPATDLDGDGTDDFVLAARHQALVLAISGGSGGILWTAARGHDLQQIIDNEAARHYEGVQSGVLYSPAPAGDVNGDGVTDFAVMIAEQDKSESGVTRWLETVCGKSGVTIWRYDFADASFAAMASLDVPESFRWFSGSGAASSWTGGSHAGFSTNGIRRQLSRLERNGYFHQIPSRPVLTSFSNSVPAAPRRFAMIAGSRLFALDVTTGEPVGEPVHCGIQPSKEPIVVDVDGDGADEWVLIQTLPDKIAPGASSPSPRVRIGVWSLAASRMLWTSDLQAELPFADWSQTAVAPPQWPQVVDLENDGRYELIVPNGTSRAYGQAMQAWGKLEVLDATTGNARWTRKIKTMDQQVPHFLSGPDIDNDGVADVFATTLWSNNFDLYVDALSGSDGKSLWVGQRRLRAITEIASYGLGPSFWWNAGGDGWPQLLVPIHSTRDSSNPPLVVAFSAGTGKQTRVGSSLIEFQTADADADHVDDLFGFVPKQLKSMDAGGKLICFRGEPRQLWNHLGERWSATVDLNGDGVRDLIRTLPDTTVQAASGRDGTTLWNATLPEKNMHQLKVVAAIPRQDGFLGPNFLADDFLSHENLDADLSTLLAPGDFDCDGTIDLLAYVSNLGKDRPSVPLFVLSGRTGRRIWAADIRARYIDAVHAIDVRDLDGDGTAEVIWVAASDWNYPDDREFSVNQKQLGLFVFAGRSGRLVYNEPLTLRYGLTPDENTSPMELQRGTLALSYGDLNGDGILDILVPADANLNEGHADRANSARELRALDGRNGSRLWQVSSPPARNPERAFSETPPTSVVDLDGDQIPEVIVLRFYSPAGERHSLAVIKALDSSDGHELWSREFKVAEQCGQIPLGEYEYRYRPRLLRLRTAQGANHVCLSLLDGTPRVIVVDLNGNTLSDFRPSSPSGFNYTGFRVWACDTDGDQSDELVLRDRDNLLAIHPESPESPIWKHELSVWGNSEIQGIVPDNALDRGLILVSQHGPAGTITAIDAASGQVSWILPIPRSQPGSHPLLTDPEQIALLTPPSCNQPTWLSLQNQFKVAVAEATMVQPFPDMPPPHTRVSANLTAAKAAPRDGNPLPWSPPAYSLAGLPILFSWAVFFCIMLVYLPGVYLLGSIRRRQWSLRWLLLSPLVAAAPLIALLVDPAVMTNTDIAHKLVLAIVTLPAVVAIVQCIRWLMLQHWKPLAAWMVASILLSTALAVLVLCFTQYASQYPLAEGEYYTNDGWWFIWLYGGYFTALLLSASMAVISISHVLQSWMHSLLYRVKK